MMDSKPKLPKSGAVILLVTAILVSALFTGCIQEKKLPAIEVCFEHYIAGNQHILRIKYAKAVLIPKSKAPVLYPWYSTPMPGIILFAYDMSGVKNMKELGVRATPSTYVPINKQGTIVAYIGFSSPKTVPKKGDKLLVVVQVLNKTGRVLASKNAVVTWNISWSP